MTAWNAPVPAWAAVLLVAGIIKLGRPDVTARALAQAFGGGLGAWRAAVRAGAAAEAVVGALSLVAGGAAADLAVATSYAAFALYVGWARRGRRPLATCGCLGEPDTPPTWSHAGLCAVAAIWAGAAATGSRPASLPSLLGALGRWAPGYLMAGSALAYATVLLVGAGPRLAGLRRVAR